MRIIPALVACAVLAAASAPTTQTPHTDRAAKLEQETVALVATRGAEARAYCSGVWVSQDEILTANHCVDDADVGDRVAYVTRGDLLASSADEVEVIRFAALDRRDELHDLAILRVRGGGAGAHAVAGLATATVGQNVQTMGHPLGLWWSYSTGQVAAIRLVGFGEDEAMWYVQATAPISPGNSGGGLFDEDGNVIGICHAYMRRGENVNLYIDARYARALVEAGTR